MLIWISLYIIWFRVINFGVFSNFFIIAFIFKMKCCNKHLTLHLKKRRLYRKDILNARSLRMRCAYRERLIAFTKRMIRGFIPTCITTVDRVSYELLWVFTVMFYVSLTAKDSWNTSCSHYKDFMFCIMPGILKTFWKANFNFSTWTLYTSCLAKGVCF